MRHSFFAILLIISLNACQNNKPEKTKTTETTSNTAKKTTPIPEFAYVNSDSLTINYEFYKEMKGDTETKGRILQAKLYQMQTGFEGEVENFKRTAGKMTMDEAKRTEQGLAMRQQELAKQGESEEMEFAKQNQKISEKISQNIAAYLKKYAKEKGYTFIFGYSKSYTGLGMIHGDETYEITNEVLKGLNDDYKASQKK